MGEFALGQIGFGLLAMLFGSLEHRRNIRFLRGYYPGMPVTIPGIAALLLAILGLVALAGGYFSRLNVAELTGCWLGFSYTWC